ncbi:MAG: hypothetical protein G01um101477_305 [Candidatus Doudnabacteria bacterium Gr01-1014_77]|uniref:PEP-utilising enzyme mobile domain-containing protein n=1 Tax=Candidatus Doudnabacteria bacterium Gr01-1014_77 TaxID=2017133 RepID=A0A554JBY7_9BACT|nr:MAG: hypothetical protein G01um101477_305 [Candidatus Doudnabacteria bacterium Gr01-1014_77]
MYNRITEINRKDYKGLQKKLNTFYKLKKSFILEVPKISVKNYKKLSNKQLAQLYLNNRHWVHQAAVFDQFGWIAEEYWPPKMKDILVNKLGIKEDSQEYHTVLFALTKPEEISTTLVEKRDVLKEAAAIKKHKQSISKASKKLSKLYGWMPVFTFGTPWDESHYTTELKGLIKIDLRELESEIKSLVNYSKIRNQEIKNIVQKYNIETKDLQIFYDFALALDTRNEGEYLVSLAGYYLLPIYKEIAKRFSLSVKQVRCLYEKEIVEVLLGKIDPEKRLHEKGKFIGWGFGSDLTERINFKTKDTEKIYKHIERNVINLQGNDDNQGVCASPGKIKGRAKIMNSPNDDKKVHQGDILIAYATTVDYLPAMKRAAAFVTEVGGLTCHAAVVAREFGVPCVVGLKNSTINFKDGDLIEVDANKGIVRKIK